MSQITADRLDYQRGVQSEPLTEKDIQLIGRLLSDATVFPREFKQWVTDHTGETIDIAKTQVHGLVNTNGQVVIGSASMGILGATLVGIVIPYAGVAAPEGWLLCDGHEILRADYPTLFALIGTAWGTPSDGTKFALPDLRGRVPFGAGGEAPFASNEGRAAGARGPRHHHRLTYSAGVSSSGYNTLNGGTDWEGDHNHAAYYDVAAATGNQRNTVSGGNNATGTGYAGGHDHGVSVGGQINVSGTVSIDADTSGGGPQDTVGYVGLSYIMGSGKVPV